VESLSKAAPFQLLPSVATWNSACYRMGSLTRSREQMRAVTPSEPMSKATQFQLLPSVATWNSASHRTGFLARLQEQRPAATPVESTSKPAPFQLLPSVATWNSAGRRTGFLARLQEQRPAAAAQAEVSLIVTKAAVPTSLLPSVGSWSGLKPQSAWLVNLKRHLKQDAQAPATTAAPAVSASADKRQPAALQRKLTRHRPKLGLEESAVAASAPGAPASVTSRSGRPHRTSTAAAGPSPQGLASSPSPETIRGSRSLRHSVSSPAGALRPQFKDSLRAFRLDADDSDEEKPESNGRMARQSSFANMFDALDTEVYRMDADSDCEVAPPARAPLGPLKVKMSPLARSPPGAAVSRPSSASAMQLDLGTGPSPAGSSSLRRPSSSTSGRAAATTLLRSGSSGALTPTSSKAMGPLPHLNLAGRGGNAADWSVPGSASRLSRRCSSASQARPL